MTEPVTEPGIEPPTGPSVLIVGAGPTGLTLACELARRDVSFRLIEAAPGPQPGSRGKGLQPRTLEVFDDLGIVDRVLAHGQMAMPIRSTAPDGQVTLGGAVPDALAGRPDIPYPASVITPEWRTEEALRLLLETLGGKVEFDTALVSLDQPDSEGVAATLLSGGTTRTITYRWVVGCDGGHSVVRKQTGIAFTGETREQVRMLVADVEVDGLDRDAWHMWRHAEGLVTLCPLPSTRLFQYQAGIAPGQDAGLDLDNLQTTLERRTGRTDIRLHEPEWSSLWRANVRLADRYREGRVLLAGDAAHIHSPAGGQGMNTGIQDAHNLGWKLAAVGDGAPPDADRHLRGRASTGGRRRAGALGRSTAADPRPEGHAAAPRPDDDPARRQLPRLVPGARRPQRPGRCRSGWCRGAPGRRPRARRDPARDDSGRTAAVRPHPRGRLDAPRLRPYRHD